MNIITKLLIDLGFIALILIGTGSIVHAAGTTSASSSSSAFASSSGNGSSFASSSASSFATNGQTSISHSTATAISGHAPVVSVTTVGAGAHGTATATVSGFPTAHVSK